MSSGHVPSVHRISIHAPTWGVTVILHFSGCHFIISIHAPTWGVTPPHSSGSPVIRYFNSRSHVGSDTEALDFLGKKYISIHAPTWGVTRSAVFSRRSFFDFNSRSHVGSDAKRCRDGLAQ